MPNRLDPIYKTIARNRAQFKSLVDQLVASLQSQYDEATAKFLYDLEQAKQCEDIEKRILNLSIVYNDNFRKLTRKIDNLIVDKNIFHSRNDHIVAHHNSLLTEKDHVHYHALFAHICNYKTKGEQEMKIYSDPKFCSYVLAKTFKKTYLEMYDFLTLAFDDKIKNRLGDKVSIAAIGGGPGNDGLALATFLRSRFLVPPKAPISVRVYDLSAKSWETCTSEAVNTAYANLMIDVAWSPMDHTKAYEDEDLEADFVTICWTLNENTEFNEKFWAELIKKNRRSVFIAIEGELQNIDKLYNLLVEAGFDETYYEKYANPRKFIAYSSK